MSRLALTLALAAALVVAGCAPAVEPRTMIASGGPRVLFDDDLRAPRNWPAAAGTICKAAYGDDGYIVENIAAVRPVPDRSGAARGLPGLVRIEISARQRKGTREGAFGLMFASRGAAENRTFATLGLTANGTYRVASWTAASGPTRCRPPPPAASRPSTAR